MATLTLSLPESIKSFLLSFPWVNWSELSREEVYKKLIFEGYIKTGEITDEQWKFCEKINWHPVDEFPLKEEFKQELERRKKGRFLKFSSVDEIFA